LSVSGSEAIFHITMTNEKPAIDAYTQPGRLYRILLIYLGLLQAVHMSVLVLDWGRLLKGFSYLRLAPPPTGGWDEDLLGNLSLLGSVDFFIALLSLVFVIALLRQVSWARGLGTLVLIAAHLTGILYLWITLDSGAFTLHVGRYVLITVLFLPVSLLTVMHLTSGFQGPRS